MIEKRKKETSGPATAHKHIMALCKEAGTLGLVDPTGSKTLDEEVVLLDAFLRGEEITETATEETLATMDPDVIEAHTMDGERSRIRRRAGDILEGRSA